MSWIYILQWVVWAVVWLPILILFSPVFFLCTLIAFISEGWEEGAKYMLNELIMKPKRRPWRSR